MRIAKISDCLINITFLSPLNAGQTPLHGVSKYRPLANFVISMLIEAGADIHALDNNKESPLMCAHNSWAKEEENENFWAEAKLHKQDSLQAMVTTFCPQELKFLLTAGGYLTIGDKNLLPFARDVGKYIVRILFQHALSCKLAFAQQEMLSASKEELQKLIDASFKRVMGKKRVSIFPISGM